MWMWLQALQQLPHLQQLQAAVAGMVAVSGAHPLAVELAPTALCTLARAGFEPV